MSAPPARTAQERERALALALRTRRERAALRTRLAAGDIGIADVLESEDPAAINEKAQALQAAFHRISEQIYEKAQQESGASANGAGGDDAPEEEEVVDAEVVDEGN